MALMECPWGDEVPKRSTGSHLTPSHSGASPQRAFWVSPWSPFILHHKGWESLLTRGAWTLA